MPHVFKHRPLACLAAAVCLSGLLAGTAAADSRYEQRQRYRQAGIALEQGRTTRFRELLASLETYPLRPYLEYAELMRYRSRMRAEQVDEFRDRYADSPLADHLLQNFLYQLLKRRDYTTFLEYDDPSLTSELLACRRPLALHAAGRSDEAWQHVQTLWRSGKSRPDECDDAFRLWRDAGQRTPERIWERLDLALESRQYSLAGYLANMLPSGQQALARHYRSLMRQPRQLRQQANRSLLTVDKPRHRHILAAVLQRLARRDAAAALTHWQQIEAAFDDTTRHAVTTTIVRQLARQGDDERLATLLESLPIEDQELLPTRTRLALRRNDLPRALALINTMTDEQQHSPRWRYWNARALAASADPADRMRGRELLEELAAERDFYGFLAADRLDLPYKSNDHPELIADADLARIAAMPPIARALELHILGERTAARREWRHGTRSLPVGDQLAAARLAARLGWHEQAISTLIQSRHLDDLRLRFPLAFADELVRESWRNDIPDTWGFAVARQESMFMTDARSGAGALGLMQLMPGTAQLMADANGLRIASDRSLLEPDLNIRLGASYLGRMLRRFSNNRVLATAAYNAGPNRVERWLRQPLPPDVWIESIPIAATRTYVQNVLFFAVIYGYRLDIPTPLITAQEADFFARRPTETGTGSTDTAAAR